MKFINDRSKYTDDNVFDLLYFLNYKKDSEDEFNGWWTRINPRTDTRIGLLFDREERIDVENANQFVSYVYLENDKLLRIGYEKPSSIGDDSFVSLRLFSNAHAFTIEVEDKPNDIKLVKIKNGKGMIVGEEREFLESPKSLPSFSLLKNVMKPVSYEQAFERGLKKGRLLEKIRQGE